MRRIVSWLDRRWMDVSWVLPGAPNRWSIRVFALRRSGHHAVVDWIRNQLPGRHCFLNDCKIGRNPFSSAVRTNSIVRGWAGDHRYVNWERELRGRHARKGVLLYNYEDGDIRAHAEDVGDAQETGWVGDSPRFSTLLVLRDPYNLFASRLKWFHGRGERPTTERFEDFRTLWKLHAGEFLGISHWLPDAVHVRYNDWFRSRAYRDELAGRIGFENTDRGVEKIARWGPALAKRPATFDGLAYDGRAQEMKVLERWKEYEEDPFFRSLFGDEELVELSRQVFGEIEGTERLSGAGRSRLS